MNKIRKIIRETLLKEGISDIVYHITNIWALEKIVKTDKLKASPAIGSAYDTSVNKGNYYFISTSRSGHRGWGFRGTNLRPEDTSCKIKLDGRKISHNHKASPIDYWKYSRDPKDFENSGNMASADEMEDRILLDKPFLEPLSEYTLSIHILADPKELNKEGSMELPHIKSIVENNRGRFKIYFYDNPKYFNHEITDKAIDTSLYAETDKGIDRREDNAYGAIDLIVLMGAFNRNLANKVIDDLFIQDRKTKQEVMNDITGFEYNLRMIGEPKELSDIKKSFRVNDKISTFMNAVHNSRSSSSEKMTKVYQHLVTDMKKNGAKTIPEYIFYKAQLAYQKHLSKVKKNG